MAFVDLRFYSINSHDLRRIDTRIKEIESEAERERGRREIERENRRLRNKSTRWKLGRKWIHLLF